MEYEELPRSKGTLIVVTEVMVSLMNIHGKTDQIVPFNICSVVHQSYSDEVGTYRKREGRQPNIDDRR